MRYLFRVMRQFQKGERAATIMDRLASAYTVKELRLIATHFAEQPWGNADTVVEENQARAGSRLHEELCEECHQKGGVDQDHEVPRLAGQWPAYLYIQLLDYRDRPEKMPQPDKMRNRLKGLSNSELDSLSQFYAGKR
jgi:sulfide dehydrogenase cytochrome subunit